MEVLVDKLRKSSKKKRKLRDIRLFIANVTAVTYNIKPSFLVDSLSPSPSVLVEMVGHVLEHVTDPVSVCILLFDNGELFVVNVATCVSRVHNILEQFDSEVAEPVVLARKCFVNISSNLTKPEIIGNNSRGSESRKIKATCESLLDMLLNCQDKMPEHLTGSSPTTTATTCIQQRHVPLINCQLPTNCNLCTVYGVLLDYPVVYWNDHLISDENCLNMTSLQVHKILIRNLFFEKEDRGGRQPSLHEIYSFSYPADLRKSLRDLVEHWTVDVAERIARYLPKDAICLQDSTVELPYLVL